MSHHKWLNIGLIISVLYCFLFQGNALNAQTSKKSKKKKEVSILKKGWDDVTTRNNYYFNAKQIYDEMLKAHERVAIIDYQDTLPYYFHDIPPSLKANSGQLQQIIIKTGVTLQRHDYSRWKDDCYTLLGKAYFLKGEMDSALVNFQYVSTALRGKFNSKKAAISQKDILKAKGARQKEMNKIANDKKKELDKKQKEKEIQTAKSAEDKKKRMEAVAKAKEKELQRKIKAKQKMLKQKAKGTYKPPSNSSNASSSSPKPEKKKKNSTSNILDKISEGITIDGKGKGGSAAELKKAEQKVKALQYTKDKLEAGNVEDSLTQKQLETIHKLTLWEKIKHLQSRPEALVWMTKTFIKQKNYADAESIVEYSKTLVKLRKKQLKDIHIVRSYYFYNTGQIKFAAEALEEAIPFIKKKKEKNYYNFLLAQLTTDASPQHAYEIYKELFKKAKDEKVSYNSLAKMYQLVETGKVGQEDTTEIIHAFKKFTKSKAVGDQALYILAELALQNGDTTQAIKNLEKAITYTSAMPSQNAKALSKLGDIAYDQYLYKNAHKYYDSASSFVKIDSVLKKRLTTIVNPLKNIVEQQDKAFQQDSLLYLSQLTREELAQYIKDQNKVERKSRRKNNAMSGDDATYVSAGIGSNSNFNSSPDQYTSKGQWYFYNVDSRTKGFNEFKQTWGERPYINDWRRAEAIQQNTLGITDIVKKLRDTASAPVLVPVLNIPSTDEEIEASHNIIAESYLKRANYFFYDLKDSQAAIRYLDSLIQRFPDHTLVPKAYYTKMLIFTELDQMKAAEKIAELLIEKYPDHELTQKILKNREVKYVKKDEKSSSQAEQYYEGLYELYQNGKYDEVLKGKLDFYQKFPQSNSLFPKINFLEALSLGQLGEKEEYKKTLETIIKLYPNTPEAAQAKIYLSSFMKLTQKEPSKIEEIKLIDDNIRFKLDDKFHFIMILLNDRKLNNATLVEAINSEMEEVFPNQRIRGSNSYLDSKTPLLLIKKFNDIEAAKSAKDIIKNSENLTIKDAVINAEILLISQDNFKELFSNKNLEEYQLFYQENYK
ncbi:MAG TPA: tetratricopeptide repeat protein [Chitinophagales bacterium]|nr:tetratricopeptide repeat protein [Chitinophagales bacterium]